MISISRGQPSWSLPFRYRRYDALAPDDRTWTQEDAGRFEASYLRQLEEIGAEPILSRLEQIGGGRPCVLLCWERLANRDEYCHRRTLASFIERETGVVIPKLLAGMVNKRPDAPQQALFD